MVTALLEAGEAPARNGLLLGLSSSFGLPPRCGSPSFRAAMGELEPDLALRVLAEVEELAEEVMGGRQQIVDLGLKQNQNREALRALSKDMETSDKVMVCFGNMFVQFGKAKTKDMLQRDQELLDEEIAKLRKELKVKVNRLLEAQGKPELKGYSLKPLSAEEMRFMRNVVDG